MYIGDKETGHAPSRLRSERGASLVEFALIAPLLFVLLFGIIEFGAMLYDQAVITNASREGARFAATYYINPAAPPAPTSTSTGTLRQCSDIQTYVQNWMTSNATIISFTSTPPPLNGCCGSSSCTPASTWSGSLDTSTGTAGNAQWIKVSYNYQFLIFGNLIRLINGSTTPTWTLTATTVMRDEDQ